MAEWRRNNPERWKEYQRRWRESHREQIRESRRQWRKAPKRGANVLAMASKSISAPNGATVNIYHFNGQDFVMLTDIAKSLGYQAFQSDNSVLAVALKNHSFTVHQKRLSAGAKPAYLILAEQCIPFLEAVVRLTLITKQSNPMILAKMDNARAAAYDMIKLFASEGYGKPRNVPQDTGEEIETSEETQMETNETIQVPVPTVTVADIEDIGERTEAVMKIFGVSKVDALRAVTQLKAQEINRELQPLIELLDGQKK